MKTLRFVFIALLIFALAPVGTALAAVERNWENGTFDFDSEVWNDCTGEFVRMTGTLMYMNLGIETKSGIIKWTSQHRYQGVKGVGLTSGIQYQAIAGDHGHGTMVISETLPYHYQVGGYDTLRMVAQGNAPDLLVKIKITVTITPNGATPVFNLAEEAYCK